MKKILGIILAAWALTVAALPGTPIGAGGTIATQNLTPTATCTATSCVCMDTVGVGVVGVQTKGTYTAAGGLSGIVTVEGSTWVTLGASTTFTRQSTGVATATITSGEQDVYLVPVLGAKKFCVTAAGAVTGSAQVTLQSVDLSTGGSGGGGGAVTNAGTFAVQPAGSVAHDAVGTGVNPILVGGYASAAAPTDVSADGDSVRAWRLRNGAEVIQPTYAGVLASTGAGASGTGTQRIISASDDPIITAINTTYAVTTATLANVSASATSVTCLASNSARKGAIIFNDSASATLYAKYGATASTTSFTFLVLPGGTLTIPTFPVYTGIIDCIWSAASGSARVTEE